MFVSCCDVSCNNLKPVLFDTTLSNERTNDDVFFVVFVLYDGTRLIWSNSVCSLLLRVDVNCVLRSNNLELIILRLNSNGRSTKCFSGKSTFDTYCLVSLSECDKFFLWCLSELALLYVGFLDSEIIININIIICVQMKEIQFTYFKSSVEHIIKSKVIISIIFITEYVLFSINMFISNYYLLNYAQPYNAYKHKIPLLQFSLTHIVHSQFNNGHFSLIIPFIVMIIYLIVIVVAHLKQHQASIFQQSEWGRVEVRCFYMYCKAN